MPQGGRDNLVLSAAAGALPLSVLFNIRDVLQLDHLHLVLFELLLLLLARVWLGTPAVRQALSSPAALTQPGPSDSPIAAEASDPDAEPPSMQASKKPPKLTAAEPSSKLYPQTTINKLLWHFVSLIDPSLLSLLPPTAASPDISICPMSDWNVTFTQDTLVVRQHPEDKAIYASSDYFPAIDLRSLYEMLVNLELRSSWDTLSERTESLERLPNGRGGADYLALRSVFPIKAKDLVLLNIFATLPPTPAGCKRVITAARSVEHPSKPPGTPGYARMDIRISGILLEEHPNGGTVFTQIADLSSLGSWIPAKIVNFITGTALPKGMRKVATAAEATPWPEQRKSLKGLEWMPPSLDSGTAEELVEAVAATSPTDLPLPSEARLLSSQMAAMTERISSLETVVRNQDRELHHHGRDLHAVEREVVSSSSSWWWPLSYFWPSNTSHSSSTAADSNHKHSKSDVKVQSKRTNRRRTDEMQTAIVRQVVASVGGVASVAAFVAWLYTRRRR